MGCVQKLPFILGSIAAILIGMIGTYSNLDQKNIYIRMAIGMVAFFAIGVYIKKVLTEIIEELEAKKREEQRKLEEEEQQRLMEEQANEQENKPQIDIKVDDDYGEDFSPLTISDYLKKNE